jgi:DNA modification methylase
VSVRILVGDARAVLATLPAESVQCVVTSPPYWGLRDYGLPPTVWGGEDPGCAHAWGAEERGRRKDLLPPSESSSSSRMGTDDRQGFGPPTGGHFCSRCNAWRGSLGLEPDPALYVAHLVEVFRAVRRILRDDGTCWVNLGDSYTAGGRGGHSGLANLEHWGRVVPPQGEGNAYVKPAVPPGLKPKDLIGIPWRVAFALQADGWYLRSEIIWHKPNPMPESVTDRPTKAHEQLFLLAKAERYYFDAEAIKEPDITRPQQWLSNGYDDRRVPGQPPQSPGMSARQAAGLGHGRNKRSVWTIPSAPFAEAHFATFPPALVEPCVQAGTSARGACPACGAPWARQVQPTADYAAMLAKPPERPHKDEFDFLAFSQYLRERREVAGLSRADIDDALGTNTAYAWWEGRTYIGAFRQQAPSWPLYLRLKELLGLDNRFDASLQRYRVRILHEGEWKHMAQDVLVEGNRKGGRAATAAYETTGWCPTCACSPAEPVRGRVLDPFAGAGTVGLVADRLGRDAILIELKPEYAAMAERRIREEAPLLTAVEVEAAAPAATDNGHGLAAPEQLGLDWPEIARVDV